MRERHIATRVLSSFTFLPRYPQTALISKKVTKYKMCVRFSLLLLSETFLILRRNEQDMITGLHVKYPYSCQILIKLEFSGHILEK
jgi:hypothetical protein